MKRIHLVELEDLPGCPDVIRETSTDFLFGLCTLVNIYELAYEKIAKVLDITNTNTIVDCCSGTGGPIKRLRNYFDQHQKKDVTIFLTDKFPNLQSFGKFEKEYPENIVGVTESIDACELPATLKGMRTFFSSFHHFKPECATQILQDAVDNEVPIAIFETTQRHPIDLIQALLSPVAVWLILPFTRRLTWKKFIFTYLIPITPFAFMWDYFVSIFRTYSIKELQAMTQQIQGTDNYHWEFGKLRSRRRSEGVIYLIGYKKQ